MTVQGYQGYSPQFIQCPLCRGAGRIRDTLAPWWAFWSRISCHECKGEGAIFVGDYEITKPPAPPPPPPKKYAAELYAAASQTKFPQIDADGNLNVSLVTHGENPGTLHFLGVRETYRVEMYFAPDLVGEYVGTAASERSLNQGGVFFIFRCADGVLRGVFSREVRDIVKVESGVGDGS